VTPELLRRGFCSIVGLLCGALMIYKGVKTIKTQYIRLKYGECEGWNARIFGAYICVVGGALIFLSILIALFGLPDR
jgi:TRAP-type C4-dicarboxylate transport system permease small subunit